MPYSIRYHFSQRFCVPARSAYRWCTNYDPQDPALMHEKAERTVLRVSEDTIILTDTYYKENRSTSKQKIVQLYPNRLSWISTHLTGPNKYSQFIYEITPEGNSASRLDFTGLQVEYGEEEKFNNKRIELLARKLRKEDSAAWKLLAKEMEKELKKDLKKQQ
jgi:hypothetical protein